MVEMAIIITLPVLILAPTETTETTTEKTKEETKEKTETASDK